MKNDDMLNYPICVWLFPLFDTAPSSETVSRDPSAWLEDFLKAWSFPANSKSVLFCVCAKREREYSYKTYIQTMVDCTKTSTVKNLPTIQIFDCTILQYFDGVKCHCTNLWLYKTSTLKICCTNFCCTNLLLSKTKSLQICCTNFCCINLRLSKTKTLQICCANFCCILVHLQLYKTSNVQALTLKDFDCPKLRLYKVMNEQNLQLLHNLDSNNTNAICAWSLY